MYPMNVSVLRSAIRQTYVVLKLEFLASFMFRRGAVIRLKTASINGLYRLFHGFYSNPYFSFG